MSCGYGSCSTCDTLQAITDGSSDIELAKEDYITLMLHLVQSMRKIAGHDMGSYE